MHIRYIFFLIILPGILLNGCSVELPQGVATAYKALPENLSYNQDVKPILSDKCFLCHGPDKNKRESGLRLDLAENAFGELPESPGKYAIKPGRLKQSEVYHRILSTDHGFKMPTPESNLTLTDHEKAVIIKWIKQGAAYQRHWAFIKPEKKEPPRVAHTDWPQNPIDRFVLKQLENKGLSPSPEADKSLLLRRLSFDLTGLPPTSEDIQAFIRDSAANAYEKQVDRLLQSPHFGERMATDWMDLARYADTHGYLVDRYRDMSPWRDWAIQAFRANMPYDQFITEQLAGDMLPNPTRDQILATGFNRLHPQNLEGGIIDEEFRVAYVSDRADVVGTGLLGLTLGCAKCHDHKFDPISQKNYYELFSFFNNVNESGQIPWDWAMPVPTLMIPTDQQKEMISFLEEKAENQEKEAGRIAGAHEATFHRWVETQSYQRISSEMFSDGLIAHFELETPALRNKANPAQKARMDRRFSASEIPVLTTGKHGNGLLLDGDAWLDLDKIGVFKRNQPFSIGLQVFLPKDLKNGYVFHKGMGTRLHSFRGYHLYLKDNRLELMMAHTWPDNAIVEYAHDSIPRETWVQFTVSYDGSSKADGLRLYMNGRELTTVVETDNLYKDIIFHNFEDNIYPAPIEPGLQIGARWRGKGLKGAKVDDVLVFQRALTALEVQKLGAPDQLNTLLATPKEQLTETGLDMLLDFFTAHHVPAYRQGLADLEKARGMVADSLENVQEVMVMKEMPQPRQTYVLERGQYDAYGEEVFPNTPETILPMPEHLPKNRLGLAQWIVSPENPLTARVAVNRYWQLLFGRGIVRTTEDFGNQGASPSHPELLDWLAVAFMESGWDVQALMKWMVMSATYRQDSKATAELKEKDPDNTWLARGPTLRLSSEMIRDNALAASGLLNPKIGGESVKPYQPEGLWKMNNAEYKQDTGDKLYRRSLYILWKRSVPHPTLATFDAPDRSECTVRRQRTNTPLQALALLNDPAFVEAAKVMGEQITLVNDPELGIRNIFFDLTGRSPNRQEMRILLRAQNTEYLAFKADRDKVKGWLETGEYQVDTDLDPCLLAANAVVASIIMNADAAITKR